MRATRLMQGGAWLILALACAGLLVHATHFDPGVAFLPEDDGPPWILAPLPDTADLIAVDPANPPEYLFVRRFESLGPTSNVWLSGRALRNARAKLNGSPLALSPRGDSWREGFEADPGPLLRSGRNQLEILVSHAHGPPLLQLELSLPDQRLESDSRWHVTAPGRRPVAARLANDLAIHPGARGMPTPLQIAPRRAPWLIGLFLVFAAAALFSSRRGLPRKAFQNAPRIVLVTLSFFWLLVFLRKFASLPAMVGFDAPAHLLYIDFLRQQLSLPTADYGVSTYHRPAFYLIAASVSSTLEWIAGAELGPVVHRLVPFLSGLACVWFTARVARRLWPDQILRPCLATGAAGLLPMNLYMSAYVSNEPFQAAVVSGCLVLAASILMSTRVSRIRWIGLGVLLGLAILTKFTSLLIAPIIAFFVSLRFWWVEGRGPGRSVLALCALLGVSAAVGGWFYARNMVLFGDPFVWNLNVPGAMTWWLRPGFHTVDWYSSFGESLVYPYFSGYASFWDGLYSTFWGDGLAGGMARLETRHGLWNSDFQTLVYPLALPATALLALGYVRLWFASFTEEDPGRRLFLALVTTLLGLLAFSLLMISLELPFYAQAKAFYILPGLLPLSLVLADGLARAAEWCTQHGGNWLAALYFGWLGTLGGVIALTYLA
ncbi:MAG: hypothetical protein VCC04_05270 [Myxococcota bacterium]